MSDGATPIMLPYDSSACSEAGESYFIIIIIIIIIIITKIYMTPKLGDPDPPFFFCQKMGPHFLEGGPWVKKKKKNQAKGVNFWRAGGPLLWGSIPPKIFACGTLKQKIFAC